MRFTALAAIASAAVVAATPVVRRPTVFWFDDIDNCDKQLRRDPVTIPDLPDCPAAIIALLPNCVAHPSDTCFANAPAFPQKCLDAIKKAFPSLAGLPASGVVTPNPVVR